MAAPAPLAARSHGRMPEKLSGKLQQPVAQRRGKLVTTRAPGRLVQNNDVLGGSVPRYRRNVG